MYVITHVEALLLWQPGLSISEDEHISFFSN